MNPSSEIASGRGQEVPRVDSGKRLAGLIAFSEKNLRYERGIKAWVFLVPYLLGAVVFEKFISPAIATGTSSLGAHLGFLAYLVFFPTLWRRTLRFIAFRKARLAQSGAS
jgi:hypothetical protein